VGGGEGGEGLAQVVSIISDIPCTVHNIYGTGAKGTTSISI